MCLTTSLTTEVTNGLTNWPDNAPLTPGSFKIRVVRTTIYHSNGQVSHMITYMPDYTAFIECHVEAAETMNDYIGYLASKWVNIDKYHTEFGVLDGNGNFKPCPAPYACARETVIDEGAIFIPGTKGRWVSPIEAKAALYERDSQL